MPLLNLTPADGSYSSDSASSGSLAGLAERMAKRKKEEEEQKARHRETEQRRSQTQKQEQPRSREQEKPKEKSLGKKVAEGFADIFKADTDADKRRREAAGQPRSYKEQQSAKRKKAEGFKEDNKGSAERGKKFAFNDDDIAQRQDVYKSQGIDIKRFLSDKKTYEEFMRESKGKSLAQLTLKGGIPEAAKRYERERKKAEKAERNFQRTKKAEAGAENVLEQAERGFVRGLAEPIARVPSDVQTIAGAALQTVAPEGTQLQRVGDKVYKAGTDNRDELAQRIVSSGYGAQEADNPLVTGLAQGTGSLAASIAAAGALRRTGAAAAMFGTQAGTDQLVDAKEAGQKDPQAFAIGASAGILEGLLEKAGLDKFLGASGSPVKQAVTRMLSEGTQEASQSLAQSAIRQTYSDVDLQQAIQQAVTEGGLGALIGGGASLPFSVAQNLQERGVDPDTALKVGMDVQERMELVLKEEQSTTSPAADTSIAEEPARYFNTEKATATVPVSQLVSTKSAEENEQGAQNAPKLMAQAAAGEIPKRDPIQVTPREDGRYDILDGNGTYTAAAAAGWANMPVEVIPQEQVAAAKELLQRANTANTGFQASMQAVAKELGLTYVEGPVKGFKRTLQKGITDYNGDFTKVQDTVRGTLEIADPKRVQEVIETLKDKVDVIRIKNGYYNQAIGYKDVKVNIRTPDGHVAEVILATPEMLRAKNELGGHELYEQARTTVDAGELAKLETEMQRLYGAAEEETSRRLASSADISTPSTIALAGGKGLPDDKTKPETVPAASSGTSRTMTSSTSKKRSRGAGAGMVTAPSKDNVTEKDEKVKDNTRQEALDALADYDVNSNKGRESMRTAEELVRLAELLNKAGQAGAILRRGDYKSKKNLGAFSRKKGGEEVVKLRDAVIKDPRMYATVLAHELSHAIEYNVNGDTKHTYKLFGDLTDAEERQIDSELQDIVDEIEGKKAAVANAEYFYKPTEMLARYVETLVLHPGKAEQLAPLVTEKFEQLVMREPMVADLMAALDDSLDKGFKNYTPDFVKDLRQMYRKRLGKRVGDLAYEAEIVRRAEIQRSQVLIDRLIKQKFKDVKDDPAKLFRAAEAILVTQNSEPQFGTHDFMDAFTDQEYKDLEKNGWKRVGPTAHDGKEGHVYTRVRYTPEQAEKLFNELSPAGQQLIKDFTAAKEEAKDEFNRELLKGLYNIDSKLEGWVHHYFENKPMGGNQKTGLRTKVAAAKKQRKGAEGYVEDFRKATEKAMLELERNEINNAFIAKQLARISKPIAKGQQPDKGWVEVVADGKGGLRLPGEGGVTILQTDDKNKSFKLPEKRYQVPEDLARHYREIRDVPGEATMAARALNRIAKYWTLNVLIHPGSTSTNFLSGGLQYGAKIMNDFYMDLLTANFGMERTRNNLIAPLKVLTPRGWTNAPDWMFGGYRSTLAGQYATGEMDTKLDQGLDAYGNKMLAVFSLVDIYWKKVIALSEGSKLSPATNRRITKRLQKDEREIVARLNEAIDTYAFDYDNKPLWLEKFDRKGGKILKPFMTYPYKLAKFYTGHVAAGFDRTLPWQQRVSKVLTVATIVAFISMLYDDREERQNTPQGTEKTPLGLKPGGRIFIGRSGNGDELFMRAAKYPFFNLTSLGRAAAKRNGTEVLDLLNEQIGTIGPGAELFMLATGRRDQFSQYTPTSVILSEQVASFIPAFRVFSDVGKIIDEKGRKPETFVQGIGTNLPIFGSEEQRANLRGKVRTIKIPDEPEKGRSLSKNERTVTTRDVTRPAEDALLSLLTGVYLRRINPKEARQQELREIRDAAEDEIRTLLRQGKEADAATLSEEYGLDIPDSVYRYYRNKR
jgi:hypothetical protein